MSEKTFDIEAFDPTVAELTALVQSTSGIKVDNLDDEKQLAVVKENRILLRNARVKIEKTGKGLRDDANKFAKAVIAKEKELIAIISPEEDRLKAIEEEVKALALRREREALLPERKKRMAEIANSSPKPIAFPLDDLILDMDDEQFETMFNQKAAERNENVRVENERKEKELNKERDEIARKKEIKEAEERAAKETEERLKREADQKAERDRVEAEKKADRERQEKEQAEAEKKAEAEKLQKRKDYMEFLKSHGWTEETKGEFKVVEEAGAYVLYKKLGSFNK